MGTQGLQLSVLVSYAAIQALAPIGVSLLLFHFYRRHGKRYMLQWSRAWLAFAVISLGAWFSFVYLSGVSLLSPLKWITTFVASQAGFAAAVFFFLGSWELSQGRPIRLLASRRIFQVAGILSLGLLVWLTTLVPAQALIHFAFTSSHSVILAAVFIGCGLLFARPREGAVSSCVLLVVMFGLMGAAELVGFLRDISRLNENPVAIYAASNTSVIMTAFFQAMLGLAMITSLLDDERQAAVEAASQVEHMAYHDELTGLPNRALFFDRLIMATQHSGRRGGRLAVFFLDLDRFKNINDSLGHSVGDALLRVTAERLRNVVRSEDTVARFGGDEFIVIIQGIQAPDDAVKVAHKVLEAMRRPFVAFGRELVVSCSIGIALFPEDGTGAEELVRNADSAMYRAKEDGRDRYRLYTHSMNADAVSRLELEMDLRSALDQSALTVHYQPQYDLEDGSLRGFEALVRWDHPRHGMLPPTTFVPMAERTGLMSRLGNFVLNQACAQGARWENESGASLSIAVNLSPPELLQPGLVSTVKAALRTTGLPANLLVIEITEAVAFRNEEVTVSILRSLKALGVSIAIDDFGSGYSSLTYLRNLPIDIVKLDQLFIGDIESGPDATITASMIQMAHGMKLNVVAEGVERPAQLAFLRQQKCDIAQGFLLNHPLPPGEIDIQQLLRGFDSD
ncbi:MAG: EAL domain-containing protein [Acidobacteria bacterium]|nr:EAL domain-containing protein [Acidobacteriota bacterium]